MKVKIDATLKENDNITHKVDCAGIKKDDVIIYKNDGVDTKIFLKNNNVKVIRRSNEYEICLDFSNEKATYKLEKENHIMDLQLTSKEIIIEEGLVKIKYNLNTKDVCTEFELYYEVL